MEKCHDPESLAKSIERKSATERWQKRKIAFKLGQKSTQSPLKTVFVYRGLIFFPAKDNIITNIRAKLEICPKGKQF